MSLRQSVFDCRCFMLVIATQCFVHVNQLRLSTVYGAPKRTLKICFLVFVETNYELLFFKQFNNLFEQIDSLFEQFAW